MRTIWLLALVGCTSGSGVAQRGVGPRPRLPTYDGQPMTTKRETQAYVEGGAAPDAANIARVQFGAGMRLRGGPTWDGTITIDAATGLGMVRAPDGTFAPPRRDLAVGIGASIHKSLGSGAFRLGLLAGGQLWRVPIVDEEMAAGGDVAPALFGALVPSLRLGSTVVFGGLSVQSAVTIPDAHEAKGDLVATTTLGVAASLGVRVDVARALWLSLTANAGMHDEDGAVGAALAVGRGFD